MRPLSATDLVAPSSVAPSIATLFDNGEHGAVLTTSAIRGSGWAAAKRRWLRDKALKTYIWIKNITRFVF